MVGDWSLDRLEEAERLALMTDAERQALLDFIQLRRREKK